jgi:hypothetical protein
MTAQPRDDARVDERGRCSPRGRDHPPSGDVQFVPTLTSFARRARMLRQELTGFPRAARDRAAAPGATVFASAWPPSPSGLSVARWPPRLRACSHEMPGFGAPAFPSALGLECLALAPPVVGVATSHIRPRWRSCLRRRCNLLASQVPRRGHLHYLQRHPRARTLSPRKGDSLGSFRDRSSGRCLELTDIGDCRGSSGGVRTAEALRSASIGPQTEPLTELVSDPVWIG